MKTNKALLFILPFLFSTVFAFSQTIDWQIHQGQGAGIFVPGPGDPSIQEILDELVGEGLPIHGDPGGFAYADIPPTNDAGWDIAPIDEDGDLCWRLDRSRLGGFMTALDFTYFQTTVNVIDASLPFILRFYQVDDGARAYVFNSANPDGTFIPGGDARLFAPIAETDISPLFVEGEENRIVIVQFDDSETQNYMKVEVVGGEGIGGGDPCDNDTEGPQILIRTEDGELLTFEDFFQEEYECEAPSFSVEFIDNCDTEIAEATTSAGTGFDPDTGASIFFATYTATDSSGNVATENYSYTLLPDTEIPTFTQTIETFTDTVNACGEYVLDLEDLGLAAEDNCDEEVEITLLETNFTAGVTTVSAIATDDAGNSNFINIELTLIENPATITVTANDDNLSVDAGESIIFNVLANDFASDGSNLEVQDLELVNPDDGSLTDNGDGTYTFTPAEGFVGEAILTYVAKSEDESLYFGETGNFYEFIPAIGISWEEARDAAATRSLNGVNGYLATVTSQEENNFIQTKLQGTGWMGATDTEEEGVWRWVTGPEAGMQFWQGDGSGMTTNNLYANWDTNAGTRFPAEPNNDMGLGNTAGEDYAHFRSDGLWNDWPNNVPSGFGVLQGYVVEYGGVDGCTPDFADEATVIITVNENIDECPSFEYTLFQGTNATCPDAADGTLTIEMTCDGCENGTFEYSFDGGEVFSTSNFTDGLAAGEYPGLIVVRNTAFPDCEFVDGLIQFASPDTEAPVLVSCTIDTVIIEIDEDGRVLGRDEGFVFVINFDEVVNNIEVVDNCTEGFFIGYEEAEDGSLIEGPGSLLGDDGFNLSVDSCDIVVLGAFIPGSEITASSDKVGKAAGKARVSQKVFAELETRNESVENVALEINPNPFQTEANLQVNLSQEEIVNIELRDISGRTVKLLSMRGSAGENNFPIQRDGLAEGVYFISVRTTSTQQTMKVIITQ